MSCLEDLTPLASIRGILPDGLVTVVSVQWHGSATLELTYKTAEGKVANELAYRYDEPRIEVVEQGRPWSFDGDGGLFRLVSEAQRIRLAHLFDPVLAVHTSVVEPLPHQITAVYESMLPRERWRIHGRPPPAPAGDYGAIHRSGTSPGRRVGAALGHTLMVGTDGHPGNSIYKHIITRMGCVCSREISRNRGSAMSNGTEVNEYDLGEGETIAIEVHEPAGRGYQSISRGTSEETKSFQSALDRIKPAADKLLSTITELAAKPEEVEVEFGIKFTGKMGAIIASTSTEGNFNIRLTWKKG